MEIDFETDCETYDCLEERLDELPNGILSRLVPTSVYNLLFGPRPPDLSLVQSRREEIQQAYEETHNSCKSLCEEVVLDKVPDGGEDSQLGWSDIDTSACLTSSWSHFTNSDHPEGNLQELLSAIKQQTTRAEQLLEEIAWLRDAANTLYLRAQEQEQLNSHRSLLRTYIRICQSGQQQVQHTIDLAERIPAAESQLKRLREQMQPYLSYDEYKINPTLKELLGLLRDDLNTAETAAEPTLLPDAKAATLERIKTQTESFADHLDRYQDDYVTRRFEEIVPQLSRQVTQLADDVTPSDISEQEQSFRDRLNEIQDAIADLRLLPLADHLSQAELERLRSIESQVANIEQRVDRFQATAVLNQCLPVWDERLAGLADQMQPYLAYETYQIDSALKESIDELHTEFKTQGAPADLDLLTEQEREQYHQVQQQIEKFSRHIADYQDEYIQKLYSEQKSTIKHSLDHLQKGLNHVKTQGQPLEDASVFRSDITEARNSITTLREYPLESHLNQAQLETIDSLEADIDDAETYLSEKTRFDLHIRQVQHSVAKAEQLAAPYVAYRKYLTRPAEKHIQQASNTARDAADKLRNQVDLPKLSTPDRTKFKRAVTTLAEIKNGLDEYNDAFVQRERARHVDLFSNIGPNELDLTPDQQRAVIRNGIYNQVIAGAGTGKTLVLTTRVAYLIRTQDVDPSQILVVAYTNEASDEMEARLEAEFGITDVEVQTVHAFGNQLIRATETERTSTADEQTALNVIDREIQRARDWNAEEFLDHYYQFLLHLDDVAPKQADFETKEAYVEARAAQDYETLRGEDVKSRAEKFIADFLFTHQVEYRYEELATWADTGADRSAYEPDFYLPEHDIHIEHWGLDTAGAVAPWFSQTSEDYRKKMRWARTQFADADARLVETYDFEHAAGWLDKALRHRLTESGVTLDRLSFEELVNSTFEYNKREKWIKDRFNDFIQNAKQFDLKPDAITDEITPANQRQFHFAQCGIHLLQQYQRYLVENDLVDYADMVQQAIDIVRLNPDAPAATYDHILVDEFQDIGQGKIELIQGLTGPDKAKLFAVGDDWQSIYSFQGAVVEYFINFEEHLGKPVQTILNTNFRSPETVVTASNDLISNNETQLSKTIDTDIGHDTTPRVHALRGHSFYDYVHRVTGYTLQLVQQYLSEGADPSDVMILCRYDDAVPYLDDIKQALQDSGIPYTGKNDRDQYRGPDGTATDGVSVYSLYQAKGREAKHVILVHTAEGPYGFPPENRDNELLDPVQPFNLNTIAEERRAFYVALTRTQHTLDLLTRSKQESRFLSEIADYTDTVNQSTAVEPLDDVGSTMSITARVDRLFDAWDKQHQAGILEDQYGGSARFVSWESDDPPTLVPDEWYRFDGVRVSEFNDEKEVIVSSRSTLIHIENQETVLENIVNTNDDKSEPVN